MEIKINDPKSTHKQMAKEMGFSDSVFNRYRNDINKNSLCNRNDGEAKKNSHRLPITPSNVKAEKYGNNNNKIFLVKFSMIKPLIIISK